MPPEFTNLVVRRAAEVLEQAGFATQRIGLGGTRELLLAENSFFVLGVVATESIDELIAVETEASNLLAERAGLIDIGAKRWDIYLLLLATERAQSDTIADLLAVSYDTTYLRRIVHTGVYSTPEDIQAALATFLPLVELASSESLKDALAELEEELPLHGVDRETAARAIAAYRQTESLQDV